MKQLELLAPAGNLEILKNVISSGADAVYFGGELFGARAYAKNFTMNEGIEGINYAHLHGKKAYLTVNTLLKNKEIEEQCFAYCKQYYEAGIDALIVQDFGVFQLLRAYFPDLNLHCSTQMTITSGYGAEYMKQLGASRIVTSRELSLQEIKKIHQKSDIEIESFCHGALCVSYSGRCLMSSMIGGRSGNRGRCAQPCRLKYEFCTQAKQTSYSNESKYYLSPKDFAAIEYLPEMAEAGVYSFKLEGRMKQKEYATGITRVYRHYLDQYLLNGKEQYTVKNKDIQYLMDLGNRGGFTNHYLFVHNDSDMISEEKSAHHNKEVSPYPMTNYHKIPLDLTVICEIGKPLRFELKDIKGIKIELEDEIVDPAKSIAISQEEIEKKINQISDTPYYFRNLHIDLDDNCFLSVAKIKQMRRAVIKKYENFYTQQWKRSFQGDYPVLKTNIEQINQSNQVNKLFWCNVSTQEQLSVVMKSNVLDYIGIPWNIAKNTINETYHGNCKYVLLLPEICREATANEIIHSFWEIYPKFEYVYASSYDELGLLEQLGVFKEEIILNHSLYQYSNYAIYSFKKLGYTSFTCGYELNKKELKHCKLQNSFLFVYGRYPLMLMANCVHKNEIHCEKKSGIYYLKDRYQSVFPVMRNCQECINIVYNSKTTNLLSDDMIRTMNLKGYRVDFTIETEEQVKTTLMQIEDFLCHKPIEFSKERETKGHWNRGVE